MWASRCIGTDHVRRLEMCVYQLLGALEMSKVGHIYCCDNLEEVVI